ncbi:kinesin-like protein KIF13A [Haliotis rufescens]|uniref:kinesin-like protein KIF13A n=1 Tax=Haliotis rufescens TaxID=6454 RepID=UPI00201F245C|nr:kinesin-like protein KIF13A [Haliotis rufescens]
MSMPASFQDYLYASGITYKVMSNIPKGSEDLEGMETLAQMAASQNETKAVDGETYIEKYIKGISVVESILTIDRLRQEVAVKEHLAVSGRSLRKTTSVPNINQMLTSPTKLEDQMRADSIQDLTSDAALSKSPTFAARPSFLNLRSSTNGNSAKRTFKLLSRFFREEHGSNMYLSP